MAESGRAARASLVGFLLPTARDEGIAIPSDKPVSASDPIQTQRPAERPPMLPTPSNHPLARSGQSNLEWSPVVRAVVVHVSASARAEAGFKIPSATYSGRRSRAGWSDCHHFHPV